MKWTKIGSSILIIDVPFKFSNFYFESPDPSSDPRRRLRKFKSGFQVFCNLLIFTPVANVFLHSVNLKFFWIWKFCDFWYGTFKGRYRRYRSLKLIFIVHNPFWKVCTCLFMHLVPKFLFDARYRYWKWIGTYEVTSGNPVP